jgi:hypothetical protein
MTEEAVAEAVVENQSRLFGDLQPGR